VYASRVLGRIVTSRYLPSRTILIALAYFVAAAASVRFTRFDGGVALIWTANALLIVDLTMRPARFWPATLALCAIGSAAATSIFGLGLAAGLGIALMMVAEAAGAAWLLGNARTRRVELRSLEGFIFFAAIAGVAAPAVGAIGGGAIVAMVTGTSFWTSWLHWFAGHALGNIIVGPILALILNGEFRTGLAHLTKARQIEALALLAVTGAIDVAVFEQSGLPILFLPMLPMMIAAFRFGRFGSAVAIVMLALVGGVMTLNGTGPVQLIQTTSGLKALFFQFYLVIAAFMTLPVAAVLQQRAELFRALRESEARYRLLMEGSSDLVLNVDPWGRVRYASQSVSELTGRPADTLIDALATDLILSDDRDLVIDTHRRALGDPGESFTVEFRALTAAGEAIWCESHTRGVIDHEGRAIGVVSQVRTIAHHKMTVAELSRAARTDALTGLANRRVFDEMLDRRIEDVRAGRGAGCCAIFDLDFFKHVNDVHGHDAGDRVLRAFAKIAAAAIRDGDLIARLGGEEFGLILWGPDLAEAHRICDRLRREVADLSVATDAGEHVAFTFSGGIVRIGTGTRAEIVIAADAALYRAKHAGRNRLVAAD
jgi:diguanylate cyclase (GGDEF)-like protein/PAS domain S-box-containing protein